MGLIECLLTAIGLSMDAFAVSVCKGLAIKRLSLKKAAIVGLWFGGFQALMPLLGYFLGTLFEQQIKSIDHWVAFALLAFIGGNMIREALSKKGEDALDQSLSFKTMLLMALATSIDALAVGITFAFLQVDILPAILIIGITTFLLSALGVKIGNVFGVKYKAKAEIVGGVILILLGLKILLEHLSIIAL